MFVFNDKFSIQDEGWCLPETIAQVAVDELSQLGQGRIFHGRSNWLLGAECLTIDFYPPVFFMVFYRQVSKDWVTKLAKELINLANLKNNYGEKLSVAIQNRMIKPIPEVEFLIGEKNQEIIVNEGPFKFLVRLGKNQNIGYFPDARLVRLYVKDHAKDKKVLNLFSYTCSFSCAALMGGAREVVNIDLSRNALEWGRENHRLNELDTKVVKFLKHDIFKSWGALKRNGPFDMVIIDPPTFQKGHFEVEKDYPKLIARLPAFINKRALIIVSLNSPYLGSDYLQGLFSHFVPQFIYQETIPSPPELHESSENKGGAKFLCFRSA